MNENYITIPGFSGRLEIVQATEGTGCVDGRPDFTAINNDLVSKLGIREIDIAPHTVGATRFPGASHGDAMTVFVAGDRKFSPRRATEIVKRYDGLNYTYHTDDHGPDGCGHVAKAIKFPDLYGFDSSESVVEIKETGNREPFKKVAVLSGPHEERGVLVVDSNDYTVNAISDKGTQFFRYDATRHEARLRDLAYFAKSFGLLTSGDQLSEVAEKQRNATLGLLAKGLPIFSVDLRDISNPRVQQVGVVGE